MEQLNILNLQTGADFAVAFSMLGGLLFAGGGLLLMFQAKRVAARLFVLGFVAIALAQMGPFALDGVPLYVLVGIGLLVALNLLWLFLAHTLTPGVANAAVGNLLANAISFILLPALLPLRMLRRFFMRRYWE